MLHLYFTLLILVLNGSAKILESDLKIYLHSTGANFIAFIILFSPFLYGRRSWILLEIHNQSLLSQAAIVLISAILQPFDY